MALISINGTEVEVMNYSWKLADQDLDSGRNLAGYMERNLLPHSVNTLTLTFPPQTAAERASLLQLLHHEYLTCVFLSPYSNSMETHTMMHGDLESALYWNVNDELGQQVLYNSFQVQLVEY